MNKVIDENKVVSLFQAKKDLATRKTLDNGNEEEKKDDSELTFEEIMKRNMANKERMRQDRLKSNKSVLRSYRIKH